MGGRLSRLIGKRLSRLNRLILVMKRRRFIFFKGKRKKKKKKKKKKKTCVKVQNLINKARWTSCNLLAK